MACTALLATAGLSSVALTAVTVASDFCLAPTTNALDLMLAATGGEPTSSYNTTYYCKNPSGTATPVH